MTTKILSTIAVIVISLAAAHAATESVILHFNGANGSSPSSGLIEDSKGNLYGTVGASGSSGCCGLVFELAPAKGGGWTQTILHVFGGPDGSDPRSPLVFDRKGNLYGTTEVGGSGDYGVVFELAPANGVWNETVLYNFSGMPDAQDPEGQIAIDAQGNIYGNTFEGGVLNQGTVYQVSPQSNGTWIETVLHTFGNIGDGIAPFGGVTLDHHGNVFGTTSRGGINNGGTVFELVPNGQGQWTETIVHKFITADGVSPQTPLAFDSAGNIYGSTLDAGAAPHGGTVFKITPGSGGTWTYSVLRNFGKIQSDGYSPSGLDFDAKGNLYGTTQYGGSGCYASQYGGCGVIFQLTPQVSGPWKETIIHPFESALDGSGPSSGVLVDNARSRLFGTTTYGGSRFGYGTVFEVRP